MRYSDTMSGVISVVYFQFYISQFIYWVWTYGILTNSHNCKTKFLLVRIFWNFFCKLNELMIVQLTFSVSSYSLFVNCVLSFISSIKRGCKNLYSPKIFSFKRLGKKSGRVQQSVFELTKTFSKFLWHSNVYWNVDEQKIIKTMLGDQNIFSSSANMNATKVVLSSG